jgi:hypothetical protein
LNGKVRLRRRKNAEASTTNCALFTTAIFYIHRRRNCHGDFVTNCMGQGTANEFDNCDQLPDGTVPNNNDDGGDGGGGGGSNGGFQRSSTPADEDNRNSHGSRRSSKVQSEKYANWLPKL